MLRQILLATVLIGGLTVCLDARQAETTVRISGDWKAVSAGGIEAFGNAGERDMRRALQEIAAFRSTLEVLIPGISVSAPEPTTLVVFRNHPSFTEFAPRDGRGRRQLNVGGYFSRAADRHYLVLPLFASRRATFQTAFHEYTHFIVSRNVRDVPLWLHEGLAEFYSTFEISDEGFAIVGKAPVDNVRTLRSERMPRLKDLLTGESEPRQFQSPDTATFYAHSWLFVHFMTLSDGGKRQGQILKYLELLPQTKSAEAAAREAFGTTLEDLDSQMIRYAEGFTLPAIRVTGVKSELQSSVLSRMTEPQVDELKARLLIELNVPREAEKYITRARAAAAADRSTRITAARLKLANEDVAGAVIEFDSVVRDFPGDFGAQFFLGQGLYEQDKPKEAIAAFEGALKVNPKAVAPWFGLSIAAMALGQYDQSDSAMAQLQELYSAADWHYQRAMEALKKGRYDAALSDARTFIGRAGVADDSAPYAAFIGVMSARRLGRAAEGLALLTRVASALPSRSWTSTVAQFMQGSLTANAFLDKADGNGERTEARYYVAMSLIDSGQRDEARKHLEWIKERGDRNYTEYSLALAELERLGPQGSKPFDSVSSAASLRTRRTRGGPLADLWRTRGGPQLSSVRRLSISPIDSSICCLRTGCVAASRCFSRLSRASLSDSTCRTFSGSIFVAAPERRRRSASSSSMRSWIRASASTSPSPASPISHY